MTQQEALELFKKTEALLEGHFQLTSGLHSNQYFQCAKVLQYPQYTEKLCQWLANQIQTQFKEINTVIAPAVGGIIVGQELARLLGTRSIFAERQDGRMVLRRGFQIQPDEIIVVAEDVITTGGSVLEVIQLVREAGGVPLAAVSVVDRSNGAVDLTIPYFATLSLQVVTYQADQCPLCANGSIAIKPGSRHLMK